MAEHERKNSGELTLEWETPGLIDIDGNHPSHLISDSYDYECRNGHGAGGPGLRCQMGMGLVY
ncbi:hypothetical protein [Desulfocicer niacini]